jgi:hypothetical protein
MLIQNRIWDKIRDQFSDAEKDALRKAIQGEAICPRGWVLDPDRLDTGLREKAKAAMKGVANGNGR